MPRILGSYFQPDLFYVMKKNILPFALAFLMLLSISPQSKAQFDPYTDVGIMVTAGVGFSGWGIPIFGRVETGVTENISVGGTLSFQSDSENFGFGSYKHTIFGINARGSYHFNELLQITNSFDVYSGLSLGYFVWNTKSDIPGVPDGTYTGSGAGGFSIGIHVGGRYLINEKIAVGVEFGGGNVLSGGTVGVTFML